VPPDAPERAPAPDYAPFFTEAVGIIDNACDNFIPG